MFLNHSPLAHTGRNEVTAATEQQESKLVMNTTCRYSHELVQKSHIKQAELCLISWDSG